MSTQSKYKKFLELVGNEPALFVSRDMGETASLIASSIDAGYQIAETPEELLELLSKNTPTVYLLKGNFSKTVYDTVVQFSGSLGLIQVMDRERMELKDTYFDKESTRLVFVGIEQEVAEVQNRFPFLDKVGLVERGAYAA